MNDKANRVIKLIFSILFFTILLGIFISFFFSNKEFKTCENRELKQKPEFSFRRTLLPEFGAYFEDNFALRKSFVFTQAEIKYKLLNSSSNPKNVLFGKENYLFYNSKEDYIYGSYSRRNLLNEEELKTFNQIHSLRKEDLKKQNIEYILAVWPNKSSIYYDKVPFSMKMQIRDTISRIDQLKFYLKKINANYSFVDVRTILQKNKSKGIYLKYDSHWNNLGAYYAYVEFLNQSYSIFNEKPFPLKEFDKIPANNYNGDLLNMLGLCNDSSIFEANPILSLKYKMDIKQIDFPIGSYCHKNPHAKSNKKVVIFRDSFGNALMQYLSLHFKEIYFFWSDYDQKMVDELKPDVVVVAKVERYF